MRAYGLIAMLVTILILSTCSALVDAAEPKRPHKLKVQIADCGDRRAPRFIYVLAPRDSSRPMHCAVI
jgi:hypothetical protein